MMVMDIASYGRKDDLAQADRLIAAEKARLFDVERYTVDEFESRMRQAIKRGTTANEHDANK